MPEFQFQEMFPSGQDTTPYRKLSADFVGTTKFDGREVLTVEPEALTLLTAQAFKDISHLLRPGHLAQLRSILDDRRGLGQRQVRGAGAPEERQHLGRRRAADVPGHRHRHRHGQEGPGGVDRRRRRGRDRQGRLQDLHRDQPALLPGLADLDVQGSADRHQPAGADRHLCDRRRRLQVPVHRQGRRLGQQELPLPADAGGAERGRAAQVPRHPDPHPGHRGLPALSPGHRGRRHLGRDEPQDREARLDALSRRPAGRRQRQGRRHPRPRDGEEGAGAHPPDGHRRAVRRQVFLPRRARDPHRPPRRLGADRHRRELLGRPPGHGQDHQGRHLPRAARDQPGALPARRSSRSSSRARWSRSTSTRAWRTRCRC